VSEFPPLACRGRGSKAAIARKWTEPTAEIAVIPWKSAGLVELFASAEIPRVRGQGQRALEDYEIRGTRSRKQTQSLVAQSISSGRWSAASNPDPGRGAVLTTRRPTDHGTYDFKASHLFSRHGQVQPHRSAASCPDPQKRASEQRSPQHSKVITMINRRAVEWQRTYVHIYNCCNHCCCWLLESRRAHLLISWTAGPPLPMHCTEYQHGRPVPGNDDEQGLGSLLRRVSALPLKAPSPTRPGSGWSASKNLGSNFPMAH
jgi:hypothetical protein